MLGTVVGFVYEFHRRSLQKRSIVDTRLDTFASKAANLGNQSGNLQATCGNQSQVFSGGAVLMAWLPFRYRSGHHRTQAVALGAGPQAFERPCACG